jgi:2-dehydropantoate 2-reductase
MMRFGILGAGAMGSVFGGRLALAGHEVTLVDVWREHLEVIDRDGLVLEVPGGESLTAHPSVAFSPDELDTVDVIIVLTKGFAARDAARSIVHAVSTDTWIVPLMNGLGVDGVLADVFEPGQIVPGTTTVGAELRGPGHARMSPRAAAEEAVTHIGAPRACERAPAGVLDLAATMSGAGLPTEVIADVDGLIWTKLAMAGTMGPLSAAMRCTITDVWNDEGARAVLRDLFVEVTDTAAAEGVELDVEAVWSHCAEVWEQNVGGYASMAVDVMAGRRTEIDSFSLEIARRAERHGVSAPLSLALGRMIGAIERTYGA